jgi:multidrug efflux pump subunit AcrA (membrane-fusion protein)
MHKPAGFLLAVLLSATAVQASDTTLLTGQVFSLQAQDIIVPMTNNWQSSISMMLPEGSKVRKGDLVVSFDGSDAQRQLEQQQLTARGETAKAQRDLAQLEMQREQAKFALQLPDGLIGALEQAENRLAAEQAAKALEDATELLADRQNALRERQKKQILDDRKFQLQQAWWQQMLVAFKVFARQDGYIIYANHPRTREKFQQGDTVQTSFNIAQIADTSDLAVKAWIHAVDQPHIKVGQTVKLWLDAVPEVSFEGVLESIADSGNKRGEWGKGVYFEAIIHFDQESAPEMMPGMSALVEVTK